MYRHSVQHTTNPFTAPAGAKRREKLAYCATVIRVMEKWYFETGDKLFKQQVNIWQSKIEAIKSERL